MDDLENILSWCEECNLNISNITWKQSKFEMTRGDGTGEKKKQINPVWSFSVHNAEQDTDGTVDVFASQFWILVNYTKYEGKHRFLKANTSTGWPMPFEVIQMHFLKHDWTIKKGYHFNKEMNSHESAMTLAIRICCQTYKANTRFKKPRSIGLYKLMIDSAKLAKTKRTTKNNNMALDSLDI